MRAYFPAPFSASLAAKVRETAENYSEEPLIARPPPKVQGFSYFNKDDMGNRFGQFLPALLAFGFARTGPFATFESPCVYWGTARGNFLIESHHWLRPSGGKPTKSRQNSTGTGINKIAAAGPSLSIVPGHTLRLTLGATVLVEAWGQSGSLA